MRFSCNIRRLENGHWSIEHSGSDVGQVTVEAATRDEAIAKIRGEIQYRLELCPCSGESYQHIVVDVVESQ